MSLAFPKPTRALPAERKRIRAVSRRDAAKDEATADRLCSALVKTLAGNRCEARGFRIECSRTLDCAHGIKRRMLSVRWAHCNTFCLCRSHHDYFEANRELWDGWRAMVLGVPLYVQVAERALSINQHDVREVIAALRQGRFIQGERA